MNAILEYLTGMGTLTDQVIAMDLLNSAKAGIMKYAIAATESATPELKATLVKHLHEAIDTHEKVTNYMIERGFYRPYEMVEQLQLDQKTVTTALNIPS